MRGKHAKRVTSDARIQVAVPETLAHRLQVIAEADGLTLSSTARRLLSRAVAREFDSLQAQSLDADDLVGAAK